MIGDLIEWQKIDLSNGLIFPWFSHPFLDQLQYWHLKDRIILELGAGRSTSWWRYRCQWVDTIETDPKWVETVYEECGNHGLQNGRIITKEIPDGVPERMPEFFALIPKDQQYDIIVVDSIYRTEALQWAIDHFNGRVGVIIADNWNQSYVWVSPKAMEIMAPYETHGFIQENHTDNDGVLKWQTAYWIINEPKNYT